MNNGSSYSHAPSCMVAIIYHYHTGKTWLGQAITLWALRPGTAVIDRGSSGAVQAWPHGHARQAAPFFCWAGLASNEYSVQFLPSLHGICSDVVVVCFSGFTFRVDDKNGHQKQ